MSRHIKTGLFGDSAVQWCKNMAREGKSPDVERSRVPAAADPVLAGLGAAASGRGLPPVHLWNPPFCGDIGLKIGRDGTWFYRGSPIGRPALVRLFSTILRKDADRYVLVTPVEMVAVEVEDAPFLAVEMRVEEAEAGPILHFRTHVDDWVSADSEHPLRFDLGAHDGVKPYLKVRGDLWALATRPICHDLIARGEIRDIDGEARYGVVSAGQFFVIAAAEAIEGLA
jgi:uncharacterized protein